MYKNLYDCFKNWYGTGGSIYIYSDPHFSDEESYKLRFPEKFELEESKTVIKQLDEMQIKNINRVCGKNDTLIILGDVGNIECISKLKAGHKVLILGNHDRGAEYYKRKIKMPTCLLGDHNALICPECGSNNTMFSIEWNDPFIEYECHDCGFKHHHISKNKLKIVENDNHLFDEVYEGTLQISPKIILSHEPVDYKYCFNIHGHVHTVNPLGAYTEKIVDFESCGGWYNCCAENINYTPINLQHLIKSGMLSKVPNIHRITINNAIDRKNKENNK